MALMIRYYSFACLVVADSSFYHVHACLTGSILIFNITRPLVIHGFSAEVTEYLLWALLSVEEVVLLCPAKYLHWRVQLYYAVCECYADIKELDHARKFVQRGLDQVKELEELEKLDPIPTPPATTAAYAKANRELNILKFKYSVMKGNTPDAIVDTLSTYFESPTDKLIAIAEALCDPARRIVRHAPCSEDQLPMFSAAARLLAPMISAIIGEAETGIQSAAGAVSAPPETVNASSPATATSGEPQSPIASIPGPDPVPIPISEAGKDSHEDGYTSYVCQARILGELFGLMNTTPSTRGQDLAKLSHALDYCTMTAYRDIPDIIADAALILWRDCKEIIDDIHANDTCVTGKADKSEQKQLARRLMQTVHSAFELVDLDDGVARAAVALRLASMYMDEKNTEKAAEVQFPAIFHDTPSSKRDTSRPSGRPSNLEQNWNDREKICMGVVQG
ncbi:hypothetical protein CBR_g1015 [Chara braunii]|uniref:Uncharacterized protein n=1 Tax=Chara braunii TaxID=69332 RepID=A0A388KD12_CHABU|nr:hypothetical protein CBR_g1015 [Chara braunii]|eukprot:GBG67896.1 hypothetical protein CBR_g1015 [Chara braunii]